MGYMERFYFRYYLTILLLSFDKPLFLAKDVAEWIEHSNVSKMIKDADLEEYEVVKMRLPTLTHRRRFIRSINAIT